VTTPTPEPPFRHVESHATGVEALFSDRRQRGDMDLLVVGAGEMGRWFAAESGADAVAFADSDPDVARAAADAVEGVRAVPLDGDDTFDAVCVAVPMPAVPAAIETHADRATEAVVDVAGEMRDAVAALQEHASGRQRASFHPLFAADNAPGNVPVVVDRPGPVVDDVRASLSAAGNRVFETTPAEHHRAMETVQAKAHTAVLAYALTADDVDPRFHTTLSAPLSDLADQVTGNQPDIYADIQARFDGGADVAATARRLAEADPETFRALYEDADR
jgi:prephenate dehydrogenase